MSPSGDRLFEERLQVQDTIQLSCQLSCFDFCQNSKHKYLCLQDLSLDE
jgi:hypothetical protein